MNEQISLKDRMANQAKELTNTVKESFAHGMKVDIPQTLMAYGRMGASEIAMGLKAFPDSIGPQETTGTVGNPTQQQISQGFEIYGKGIDNEIEASVEPQVQPQIDMEPDHDL